MTTAVVRSPAVPPTDVQRNARVMVVWCPDWPVVAAVSDLDLSAQLPVAVLTSGEVLACSASARLDGVRRGMRRRDAAARCPELVLVEESSARDVRAFDAVLAAVEDVGSTVTPLRPGLCALPVPSRFYGGEQQAGGIIGERLVELGAWDTRMGVADGLFAAEQAARRAATQETVIVPPGSSARYLSGLSVSILDAPDLVSLLRRLGIRTVGEFAALTSRDVSTRFGQHGAWLHRLSRGLDARVAAGRRPPRELDQAVTFEPPLETIEPIVFSSRRTAEEFVAGMAAYGLVCTRLGIEITGDTGWTSYRIWGHSRWFGTTDVVDRLFWQLQASPSPEPVIGVRFVPEVVESVGDHGDGLWGSAQDEKVERGIARLQGMLGPDAVQAPGVQGGRGPRERQAAVTWGEPRADRRDRALPWPGSIPPPAPVRVFAEPRPAEVRGRGGHPVGVSPRGAITTEPVLLRPYADAEPVAIQAWAGPWPIDELWWDPAGARQVARFQMVGVDGRAWLLMVENGTWWTEASYE